MKKLYVYTIHLPDGTNAITPPYSDLIQLRKGTMSLITSLVMDPVLRDQLKAKASSDIAELKDSAKEYIRAGKEAAKARMPSPLKEPGKKLGSSYAYVKAWREANPEKYAEAKANEKLRKAGLLPDASVMKAEKQKKRKLNQLAVIKEELHRLRGSASIEYSRLNKKKKALELELGLVK